jgi:hypothetical protein
MYRHKHRPISYIYKAECLFVSLFVCLFVPYTNSHFWTDLDQTLRTYPPWSWRDRRVCMVRKCLIFSNFFTFLVGIECQIFGTKWLPAQVIRDSVISVILSAVSVTSRKWRCSRRQFRVLQESSATALYPWFLLVLVWRHGNDVVADDSFAFSMEVSCTVGNA